MWVQNMDKVELKKGENVQKIWEDVQEIDVPILLYLKSKAILANPTANRTSAVYILCLNLRDKSPFRAS